MQNNTDRRSDCIAGLVERHEVLSTDWTYRGCPHLLPSQRLENAGVCGRFSHSSVLWEKAPEQMYCLANKLCCLALRGISQMNDVWTHSLFSLLITEKFEEFVKYCEKQMPHSHRIAQEGLYSVLHCARC